MPYRQFLQEQKGDKKVIGLLLKNVKKVDIDQIKPPPSTTSAQVTKIRKGSLASRNTAIKVKKPI